MAEECIFYYYDNGYSCALKREKEGNSSIDSDIVHRYCWGYHYEECPRYKNRNSSSSTGCFLTSACVEAKGLPDDCRELTVKIFANITVQLLLLQKKSSNAPMRWKSLRRFILNWLSLVSLSLITVTTKKHITNTRIMFKNCNQNTAAELLLSLRKRNALCGFGLF